MMWMSIEAKVPSSLFHPCPGLTTKVAKVIMWSAYKNDWFRGECVRYVAGADWWPEGVTHWRPDLSSPSA